MCISSDFKMIKTLLYLEKNLLLAGGSSWISINYDDANIIVDVEYIYLHWKF